MFVRFYSCLWFKKDDTNSVFPAVHNGNVLVEVNSYLCYLPLIDWRQILSSKARLINTMGRKNHESCNTGNLAVAEGVAQLKISLFKDQSCVPHSAQRIAVGDPNHFSVNSVSLPYSLLYSF